jgi:hypothetical protein
LRPSFGERRVALVEELCDVAEQQRPRERRRLRGLDLDEAHPTRLDVAHQAHQPGQVEHVLQALAHRLEDDRERPVVARDREQLGRTLALLPQRRTTTGVASRQQQGPGRTLPEPCREQR